ncbi:hypothetical protein Patl1_33997 [Pistacia atlantica]|uniref:Uncharacterized protein n=1 Tax=Pistacia atlantica TaxID=434234 RepID=A0ACC0ZNT3_9ROSI|nr:hypothetical protein Patl1_33997 [Pistacia atlantica]
MEQQQNLPVLAKRMWSIIAGKALSNLLHHHSHHNHHHHVSSYVVPPNEYEFSCSNTPNYTFPFHLNKRKSNYHHFFGCAHAPPTDDDDVTTVNTVKVVLEMFNNNEMAVEASPALPGFERSPFVRPLRITDSPFPLRDVDEDNGYVDKAAEEFIQKFYKELKKQKKLSMAEC